MRTYIKLVTYLKNCGFRPQVQWLDNGASNLLKTFNQDNDIAFSIGAATHASLQCSRMSNSDLEESFRGQTLQHRQSISNASVGWLNSSSNAHAEPTLPFKTQYPRVSTYAMLEGNFDFNKTPMVPPGTKVIIHEKPLQCWRWEPHGVNDGTLDPP